MKRVIILFLFLLPLAYCSVEAKDNKFILVLDPGHGGSEPGAIGKKSKEKDINLAVALLVGKQIRDSHPDVEIIYTRNKDVTVSLLKRSQIANNAKANLFISIHANSTRKGGSIKGAEVFTYGPTKSNANLEVLERENEILYLEDEFKGLSVADFLNSDETSIIVDMMQMVYHENSFNLATLIQNQLVSKAKRGNRGVKSDNFAVLRNASMPSVLIELDFISCPEAENYMISKDGQRTLAQCIYNAFAEYKKNFDIKKNNTNIKADKPEPATTPTPTAQAEAKTKAKEELVYKVQIMASPVELKPSELKGYEASYYQEDGLYKYTIGNTTNKDEINQLRNKLQKDFKGAFVILFKDGVRVKK